MASILNIASTTKTFRVAVVGVGSATAYGRPVEEDTDPTLKEEGGAPPLAGFALDLKLRRFWADDLRRIAGRWASEMGAMDITVLKVVMADTLESSTARRPRDGDEKRARCWSRGGTAAF